MNKYFRLFIQSVEIMLIKSIYLTAFTFIISFYLLVFFLWFKVELSTINSNFPSPTFCKKNLYNKYLR